MNRTEPKNRWFRVGRGTQIMVLGLAVFGAYSVISQPSAPQSVYFEADRSGRLVRVDRPAASPKPLPPLWKPEPQLILDERVRLGLDDGQARSIQQISDRWTTIKRELESSMSASAPKPSGSQESVGEISGGLAGYSALSRTYDAKRNASWSAALSRLTREQRADVAKLAPQGGGK